MHATATFTTKDNRIVELHLDDDWESVKVYCNGKQIGIFKFDPGDYKAAHLIYMFLDQYDSSFLGQGIGARILEFYHDETGLNIFTTPDDGIRRDDGSHLTGNAPGFVNRMKAKGLIEKCLDDCEDEIY